MVQFFSQQFSFPSVLTSLLKDRRRVELTAVLPFLFSLPSAVCRHEWTKVTMGVWQKYPNPSSAHVTCVDTIDRTVDPLTGIIRTCVLLPLLRPLALYPPLLEIGQSCTKPDM